MSRTVTRLAGSAIAVAALALTACSQVHTMDNYAASDGVRVELSKQVKAENVLILASEEGADARIVGGLTNNTNSDVEFTIGFVDGSSETIEVAARSTVLLDGSDERDVVLDDVPAGPGSTVDMSFSTPELGASTYAVPVLDGTFAEYADLVP